LVRVSR